MIRPPRRGRRGRPRPSISLVCATRHPSALVAAAFRPLAGLVDEIIIAADDRVSSARLAGYRRIADVVVRFPFAGANHVRPWLASQARGEWLLVLDGDETPGLELCGRLQDAVSDRTCAAYSLPCRWVHPDPTRHLASDPWADDRHLRLVRNDDRAWFPGEKHASGASTSGPMRLLDAPFYHLDLLLNDEDARRAKVARYRGEAQPLLTRSGREVNAAYYLPEDAPGLAHAALPPEDAEHVRTVLQAAAGDRPEVGRWQPPWRRVRTVARDELDRAHPRHHRASPYAVSLEIRSAPSAMPARSMATVEVVLSNRGAETLTVAPPQLDDLRLSYRWRDRSGDVVVADGRRTPLAHRLPPGRSAPMKVLVEAPARRGVHTLAIDVVHEGRRWLGAEVSREVEVTTSVEERLRRGADPSGLVPLRECWRVRRELRRPDALAEALCGVGPDADVGARSGAGIDGAVLALGTGTALIAEVAERLDDSGALLVPPAPPDELWCRAEVAARGWGSVIRIMSASGPPFEPADLLEAVREELGGSEIGAVVLAGPPELGGLLGDGGPAMLRPLLARRTPLIMVDALTDAALLAAERWDQDDGVRIVGVRLARDGLMEGMILRAEAGPRGSGGRRPGTPVSPARRRS